MRTLSRDALARSICARLCDERRTHDELRVIDDVLAGLEHGAETIGPLDLERDERDFGEEGAQECRDLLAYLAMQKVAAAHRRREWSAALDTPSGPNADGEFEDEELTAERLTGNASEHPLKADRPHVPTATYTSANTGGAHPSNTHSSSSIPPSPSSEEGASKPAAESAGRTSLYPDGTRCRVFDTECINPAWCAARGVCGGGDILCVPGAIPLAVSCPEVAPQTATPTGSHDPEGAAVGTFWPSVSPVQRSSSPGDGRTFLDAVDFLTGQCAHCNCVVADCACGCKHCAADLESPLTCCPRFCWGDGTHDPSCTLPTPSSSWTVTDGEVSKP